MSHEHKKALGKIITLCEKGTNPTKRSERIFDIALEAFGLTANQREFEIRKVRERAEAARQERINRITAKLNNLGSNNE